MALEISTKSYEQELLEQERHAEQRQQQSRESGDALALEESSRILEITEQVREGFRKAGTSTHQIKTLEGNSPQSGTVALGAYQQEVHHVGSIGLAHLQEFTHTEPGGDVAEHVSSTLAHELRHQESHRKALARGEAGLIRSVLGQDLDHDLQESMASNGTTEGIDAYDPERARASQFAAQIGKSRQAVSRLLLEGRELEIVEAALENGVIRTAA